MWLVEVEGFLVVFAPVLVCLVLVGLSSVVVSVGAACARFEDGLVAVASAAGLASWVAWLCAGLVAVGVWVVDPGQVVWAWVGLGVCGLGAVTSMLVVAVLQRRGARLAAVGLVG